MILALSQSKNVVIKRRLTKSHSKSSHNSEEKKMRQANIDLFLFFHRINLNDLDQSNSCGKGVEFCEIFRGNTEKID